MKIDMLRVLHLTDAHFGGNDFGGSGPTIRNNVTAEFKKSLRYVLESKVNSIDAVAVTGDLVTGGKWHKARLELENFFSSLRDTLQRSGSRPHYFFVPGNHDVERLKLTSAESSVIKNWDRDQRGSQAIWTRSPDCLLTPRIQEAFTKYSNGITELAQQGLVDLYEESHAGILPGDYSASFDRNGLCVGILGLNSAFLQIDRDDRLQRVEARLAQATAATPENNLAAWTESRDICLLLTHHDAGQFHSRDQFLGEVDQPGRFAAHLCGDEHDPKHQSRSDYHAPQRFTILGSPLNGLRSESSGSGIDRRHGFSIIEFARIGKQQIHRSAVFGWSKTRGQFVPDARFPRDEMFEFWGPWQPFAPTAGYDLINPGTHGPAESNSDDPSIWPRTATGRGGSDKLKVATPEESLQAAEDENAKASAEGPTAPDESVPSSVISQHTSSDVRNPYRGLTYHEVGDKLYGRADQIRSAVNALQARFAGPATNLPIIRITGVSGSGKSSFLHAGLITAIATADFSGKTIAVAVRFLPSQWASASPLDLILRLFEELSSVDARLRLEMREIAYLQQSPTLAGKVAGRLLSEKVSALAETQLVIGIDQFEELIDALQGGRQATSVSALLECVDTAIQATPSAIGLAYTLESSRDASVKSLYQKGYLGDSYAADACESIPMDDSSDVRFIKGVIAEPFRDAGYPLTRAVLNRLVDQYKKLTSTHMFGRSDACALLPLVSLRLFKLFERVKTVMKPLQDIDVAPRLPQPDQTAVETDEEKGYVTEAIIGTDIGFASVIDEIGNTAWERATRRTKIDMAELSHILQPLVGLDGDGLELFDIPEPTYHRDRERIHALSEARLLTRTRDGSTTRYRLAHETILSHWKSAAAWLEKSRSYLMTEQRTRARARLWESEGRPELEAFEVTTDRIRSAAMVLSENFRLWSMTPTARLQDQVLMDYCLRVFSHSTDPHARIPKIFINDDFEGVEARSIAAKYGLIDLLETYGSLEPDVISEEFGPDSTTGPSSLTLLHRATWSQPDLTRLLLQRGARHDVADSDGWLPISGAITGSSPECYLALDEHGVSHKYANEESKITVAASAAMHDRMDVLERALELEGTKIFEDTSVDGWLPIHMAAAGGAINAMRFILRHSNTARKTTGKTGMTALHIACAHCRIDFVMALLSDLSALLGEEECRRFVRMEDESGKTALWHACASLAPGAVRSLLPHARPSKARRLKDNTYDHAIHAALAPHHPSQIGLLFDEDHNTVARDEERIYEVVSILLEHGSMDVNTMGSTGRSPLELAKGLPRVQALILNHPAIRALEPASEGGASPLVLAARYGQWVTVERMLKQVRDVISESPGMLVGEERSSSLLHLATAPEASAVLSTMLELCGPDTGSKVDKKGDTPARVAVQRKNARALKMLLDRFGPESLARDKKPDSSLFESAVTSNKDSGQLLNILASSADTYADELDRLGWTACHVTCFAQSQEWVRRLLDCLGADHPAWELRDELGHRPVDFLHPSRRRNLLPNTKGKTAPWPEEREWDSSLIWEPLNIELVQEFIDQESPIDGKLEVTAETIIDRAWPAFYGGRASIVRIQDEAWPIEHLSIYYLRSEAGELFRLNGTSLSIREMNAKAPIEINEQNVLNYLRFYCFFVRGEKGSFFILESRHAINIPDIPDPDEQKQINQLAVPPRLCRIDFTYSFHYCSAMVWYSNSIFLAKFNVRPTGTIEMFDDLLLATDLSCSPVAPISVSIL